MAESVKVTVTGMSDLKKALEALGEAATGKMLAQAALAGALPIQNAAKEKSPKRTRTLSRSIHTEVEKEGETLAEVVVGTDVEYAAIQEFGGTITPKNTKYLAIPLTSAAERYGSPRNYPVRLIPVIRGGEGVLIDVVDYEAVYALKKSVTIPARPYLRPALDESVEAVKSAISRALKQQLEAVK